MSLLTLLGTNVPAVLYHRRFVCLRV